MPARYAPRFGHSAVRYALSLVGRPYGVGWCQRFTNEVFQTGSVGDWDGDGSADAEDGWKKAMARGRVVKASQIKRYSDIPEGVMLYWLGGSHDHGHAAVSVGGGYMVSTDLPYTGRIGKVPISLPHTRWGLTFAGYVLIEGNGYQLTNIDSPPPAHFQPGVYVVTANKLNGRAKPSLASKIKYVRKRGFKVKIVKLVNAGGRTWGITQEPFNTAYAFAYLKRI